MNADRANARFRHGILEPDADAARNPNNRALLGNATLGIEVTDPDLAAACGLGNIDPQHGAAPRGQAAIEAAQSWPLPPRGATLVTIRPDADAFGAMAVLGLRADRVAFDAGMKRRLDLIAQHDRFDLGPWPGRRDLPDCPEDIDEVGLGPERIGALIGGLARPGLAADHKVLIVRRWLTLGQVPPAWHDRAADAALALYAAYHHGNVKVHDLEPGLLALVEGSAPGALRLGYRLAPVVIATTMKADAHNNTLMRRLTIAQWRTGHVDLGAVVRRLSEDERGWGGSPTIIGSPQGRSCRTDITAIIDVVRSCAVRDASARGRQQGASHAA